MNQLKVSVITVCYNSIATIEQTIISVKNQTYKNLEHIIIDGGSEDGTLDIIRKYEDDIAYWISEPDVGIYDAMNKGIMHATGDIIAILNSDDWYEADALENVSRYFEKESQEIVVGKVNHVINGRIFSPQMTFESIEDIHLRMIFQHPGMFVKKIVYEKVGLFNLEYSIAADYEWTLRAHNAGMKFECIPEVLTNFRMNGVSTMQAYQVRIENRKIALRGMNQHACAEMAEKIEKYYDEVIEKNKSNYIYQRVWRNELEYIKTLMDYKKEYYIWGTGYYGEVCYELFEALKLKIAGFMDNCVRQGELHNYPVCKPREVKDNEIICIATPKYEKEIVSQIQRMGISEEQYFCFSEVQNKVSNQLKKQNKYSSI